MIDSFREEYRFLSNFWPATVEYDGVAYTSIELAYVAAKFPMDTMVSIIGADLKPEDILLRTLIKRSTPGKAKRLGRRYVRLIRPEWDEVKLTVMEGLLWQKFRNQPMRQLLLDTGDEELVEGNTWGDTFWGVCDGVGENNLGKLLMMIRGKLKEWTL